MPNPLKHDPTKTTTLRKQFMADMTRRFKALNEDIQELVLKDDAFGLVPGKRLEFNQQVTQQAWRFHTDAGKIKASAPAVESALGAKLKDALLAKKK